MSDLPAQKVGQKEDQGLTSGAFRRLLNWLDGGSDSGGQMYLEMRRRLVAYFDRRNCPVPDELADETLNRVARRLVEEGVIEADAPARYCYITARFVLMEHRRGARKSNVPLEEVRRQARGDSLAAPEAEDENEKEKLLNCLEQCLGELEPQSREVIVRYYTGKERVKIENRRALAKELGITANALSIRSCRIRDKLEACVRRCIGSE
jgi:DNA-directed RNA polymerase specialized sigma24 family protein